MTDRVDYLEAKRAVDDAALDREALATLSDRLPPEPVVLEAGAGTVTMVERLHEWGIVAGGRWVAVDADPEALRSGRERLLERAATPVGEPSPRRGGDTANGSNPADGTTTGRERDGDVPGFAPVRLGAIRVEFVVADVFEADAEGYLSGSLPDRDDLSGSPPDGVGRYDLLVGCAFFDLVDADRAVDALGGVADLVYAPITYDGETAFSPSDPADDTVLDRYRMHMEGHRDGSPEGATALSRAFDRAGWTCIHDGPSPWRIVPPYFEAERTVVTHVIETIEDAVGRTGFDASEWAARRRRDLANEALQYEAANRDLLFRR